MLPAIQREFVWDTDQICMLFDSLMRGYPFASFLFWKVRKENSRKYVFYDFIREYHQRDAPHFDARRERLATRLRELLNISGHAANAR